MPSPRPFSGSPSPTPHRALNLRGWTLRAVMLLLLTTPVVHAPLAAQVPTPPPGSTGVIEGEVAGPDGAPLVSVAVTLRNAEDSAMVTGALTNARGRFRLEGLTLDRYTLHVGILGYQSRSSEVIALTRESPSVNLGTITLEAAPIEMEGLEALVDRPAMTVEADRTNYDVRRMPVAGAGSAADVLRAVPELEVDVNDNVRLRGNQAAAIHLNGRPTPLRGEQLAEFLRQLPGDRLERVEVIPNPSARYDPEGMGGIVNIVLREDVEIGLSGSVNVTASNRGRQMLGGRFNVQRGRLTLFSGGGINRMSNQGTLWDERTNLAANPVTTILQEAENDNRSRGWNGDWTAELNVGEGATLWSNAYLFNSGSETEGLTTYRIFEEGDRTLERYDRTNLREGSFHNYTISGGFRKVFTPQQEEFSIDTRVTRGGSDTEAATAQLLYAAAAGPDDTGIPAELRLNEIFGNNGNVMLQTDYFRPVAGGRLELGYRAWYRDQDNDNLLQIFGSPEPNGEPDQSLRGAYDFQERFHSLYGTYARSFGPFRAQLGLRGEFAATTFDSPVGNTSFERSYNTLFPSMNLSWQVREGRTARFLYSKRIGRPFPFYLDPFTPPTDPLNLQVGNPDLRPSYTQSFTVDYSITGQRGTLRIAPFYRHSSDVWERIRTVDADGVATSRWENAATARAYGSSVTLSLRPMGKLSGSANVSVYRDERDGRNIREGLEGSAFSWSLGGNVGIRLSESLTAMVNANRFPMQSILQGSASAYTFTSLALRQQVLNRRGTVSLNVSDPLNLNRFDSTVRDATFIQSSRNSFSSRMISLGFTVNLGQTPQRQSRPTQQGPEQGGAEPIRVP